MSKDPMKHEFKILPYDPIWKELYLSERDRLIEIFDESLNSIHHIGSTAIPNTRAKPEIDILVVVKEDLNLSEKNRAIEELGYRVRGECLENGGTPGRFYYSKDVSNRRTHKLHICKEGHSDILSQLLFVKYLNEHIEVAIEYYELKIALSRDYNYGKNIEKYLAGKTDLIREVLSKALEEDGVARYEDFL